MGVGVALTAVPTTWVIVLGLAISTMGFFAAHGIASAWVTRRARIGKAQASALYLVAYYLGASILGTLGGYAWTAWSWPGVLLISGGGTFLALLVALKLTTVPPLPTPEHAATPPVAQ